MSRIQLTPEQASAFIEQTEPVALCDEQGNVVVTAIPPKLREIIEENKRRARSLGPRYSSEQVHAVMLALEEATRREGPISHDRKTEIVAAMKSKWHQ